MIFGWKVYDRSFEHVVIYVWNPWFYKLLGAPVFIVLHEARPALFEFKRDTFSHYADTIHSINQRLHVALEHVSYQNFDHAIHLKKR